MLRSFALFIASVMDAEKRRFSSDPSARLHVDRGGGVSLLMRIGFWSLDSKRSAFEAVLSPVVRSGGQTMLVMADHPLPSFSFVLA